LKVAAVQIGATQDKGQNYLKILNYIDLAFKRFGKLDLICLPELCYALPDQGDTKNIVETCEDFSKKFAPVARENNAYLVAGSFPEISPEGKVYNTCLVFDRKGERIASYRKIHLFDALGRKESDVFSPGREAIVFRTEFGPVGVMICYDLRFPEMHGQLVKKGAKVIAVPAAFYSPRIDHWEILNRFLAMNTQCYVVAANQIGNMRNEKRVFCGRSTIVDPWGVAVATASDKETVCFAELDFPYQEQVKERLPLWRE